MKDLQTFFVKFRLRVRVLSNFDFEKEELFRSVIEKVQSINENCRLVIEFSFSYIVKKFAL